MKRVLVTGASDGIGKSIAEHYYDNGYYVIALGKRKTPSTRSHEYISCDLSLDNDLEKLMQNIDDIDVLINNAGINPIANFCSIKYEDFIQVQKVNLYAPFRLCQRYVPHMIEQKWGRIVNICSVWSKKSKVGRASYSTSKFGLNGMSIALSHEVVKDNVLVNCISPGFVDTQLTRINMGNNIDSILNQVPINRLCQTEEIAKTVFWLGSDQNTFIAGQNIMVDGGFTLA
jgi:NAD(P)-dependent dehydrogenase (short-subunit alcohol dehydrogenase family)